MIYFICRMKYINLIKHLSYEAFFIFDSFFRSMSIL
nr:MAG TPA: hypothetical protein [Caudoviricetes sp.]